jgi:rhodanese-related sulfurtransferase
MGAGAEKIGDETLQRLVAEEGAQVVEVLGRSEYEQAHLPGALHIWLPRLDERAPRELDRDRPVVVYCNDFL